MSFLKFDQVNAPGRKTKLFNVWNSSNGTQLGMVAFSGSWRKFVFSPNSETIFDSGCLREIADFLDRQTEEWKRSPKA